MGVRGDEPGPSAREVGRSQVEKLGRIIRERRVQAELSLRDLAARTNVSNPYLSQIERGLHQPSVRVLKAIAGALNMSAETLMVQAGLLDEPATRAGTVGGRCRAGRPRPDRRPAGRAAGGVPQLRRSEPRRRLSPRHAPHRPGPTRPTRTRRTARGGGSGRLVGLAPSSTRAATVAARGVRRRTSWWPWSTSSPWRRAAAGRGRGVVVDERVLGDERRDERGRRVDDLGRRGQRGRVRDTSGSRSSTRATPFCDVRGDGFGHGGRRGRHGAGDRLGDGGDRRGHGVGWSCAHYVSTRLIHHVTSTT